MVFVSVVACRREAQVRPAAAVSATPSVSASVAAATPSAVTAPTAVAARPEPTSSSNPATPRQPSGPITVLTPDVQRLMDLCDKAVARARKASLAKQLAEADELLSNCLAEAPWASVALAERGFARLQAGQLAEAEADLANAERNSAPTSLLRQQIVHNRALVAKRQQDAKAERRLAELEATLKESRRLPAPLRCENEPREPDLTLLRPKSVPEALQLMQAAHAKAAEISVGGVEFEVVGAADTSAKKLLEQVKDGKLPNGAWTFTTGEGGTTANHVLIARSGELYLYPKLSFGQAYRCGQEGLAELTVNGGGLQPFYILRHVVESMAAYECTDGTTHCPSYCPWISSTVDLTLLDAQSLKAAHQYRFSITPEGKAMAKPEGLLDFEWHSKSFVVKACGKSTTLSYAP